MCTEVSVLSLKFIHCTALRDDTVFIHIHRHNTHTKFSIGRHTGVGNMYQRGYPSHHDTAETSRVTYVSTTCIHPTIVGNTHQRGYPSHHDRRERPQYDLSICPSHMCMYSNCRQRTGGTTSICACARVLTAGIINIYKGSSTVRNYSPTQCIEFPQ